MEMGSLIVDLQHWLAAMLEEAEAQPSDSAERGARVEVLERFRSSCREVSLARLAVDLERQRYRELLEVVSQGYLLTDTEGAIREANDAAAALLNMDPESLCGRSLASFVAEDGRQDFAERIRQLLQVDGGSIQQWQSHLQPTGRTSFRASFILFPWRDPEGQTTRLYWLLYDLTDRFETMRALQLSELRHQMLIEGINDVLFATDLEGCFTYVSPAVERISNYAPREIVGRHLSHIVHPEDLPSVLVGMEHAEETYGETYEFRILRKDGAVVHLRVRSRALLKDGEVQGFAGMAADITAQREHERELRAVANVAGALRNVQSLAEMPSIIVKQSIELLQAQGAYLALRDPKTDEIIMGAGRGAWPHEPKLCVQSGMDMIAFVMSTGRPCTNADVRADPHLEPAAGSSASLPAVVCYPLITEGQVIGALAVGRQREFTNGDVRILAVLVEIASSAIHRARLHEQTLALNDQLAYRERFIARIVDSIPSSLLVLDRALRVVSVNRNFEEKTRRDARTTVGQRIQDVFPRVLIEYTHLDEMAREVFRTGQSVEGDKVAYRAPNIPTRIYYYRCIPLKADDATVENVMVLMDDITERERLGEEMRRAERHLASVVECANDLVISTDAQGLIMTCNRATEITLRRSAEEIRGRFLADFCVPEPRLELGELLQRLHRGELVRNYEVTLLTPEGQQVPIAWSFSPMPDDTGKMTGIVMMGRDLTERRQLESQLIQSAKIASLGVMAGGIAHELRNPLGVISANAQLLLDYPGDAQLASECAEKTWAATQRASLIIENLLKFASPQPEQTFDLDLNAALEEILGLLANQLSLRKITLQKNLQADLHRVCGNTPLLEQVFANLVLNACNAMREGGLLEVTSRASEEREVEISFRDTGCGISPENMTRIFDPFFTTMPVGQGVGLGLSISYSIIRQHQGEILVESQVGQGTTFTVRLPVNPAPTTAGPERGALQ